MIEEVGPFDESLPASEDLDRWIRLFDHFHMLAIDEVLYERRTHADQMTNDLELLARGRRRIARKHADTPPDPSLDGIGHWPGDRRNWADGRRPGRACAVR